jgi:hypothetical protein
MAKIKRIGCNAHIREVIAQLPTYWDSLDDAIQCVKYVLSLGGYEFLAESVSFVKPPDDGTELFRIKGVENCIMFQWYKMEVSGKYEITTYISI